MHFPYKQPDQIIEMLADIISKNGCMLLNVLQRPDGSIDDDAEFILRELAGWFAVNAEAVYGTRPWRVFGEGETRVRIEGFREDKTDWNRSDFRFTQKDGAVYAFMMGLKPGETAVLRSFEGQEIHSVSLLGAGELPFHYEYSVLSVPIPVKMPTRYTGVLRIR